MIMVPYTLPSGNFWEPSMGALVSRSSRGLTLGIQLKIYRLGSRISVVGFRAYD